MSLETIIYIVVIIYSIILHEIAHGYIAFREGDSTAKWNGRLTLNPIPHIDILGSIIFPLLSFFSLGAIMGWAKGVPYNPNLLKYKYSETRVAAAGVAANLLIAVLSIILYKVIIFVDNIFLLKSGLIINDSVVLSGVLVFLVIITMVNINLAIFNLLPLPPFDGLRIITSISHKWGRTINDMMSKYQYQFIIISLFIAYNIAPHLVAFNNAIIRFLLY